MDKSPQFDGLRGVACLLVLIPHSRYFGFYIHEYISLGRFAQFGLFLFFFLSAYLISKSIYSDHASGNAQKWGGYVVRRVLRIVPLYYAVLVLDFLFTRFYFGDAGPHDAASLLRHILFLEGRSALWTMPVEMSFYFLLIPLMFGMGLILRMPERQKKLGLVAAGTASLAWLAYVWLIDQTSPIATWGVHEYAPYFVFGSVWAAIQIGFAEDLDRIPRMAWNFIGLAAAAAFLIQNPLWWQTLFPGNTWTYNPDDMEGLTFDVFLAWRKYAMVLVVLVMFLTLERPASWLKSLLSTPLLVSAGKYSFGIYLIHMPIVFLVRDHVTTIPQVGFFWIVLMTSAVAILLYNLVERPGIRAGRFLIDRMLSRQAPLTKQQSGP